MQFSACRHRGRRCAQLVTHAHLRQMSFAGIACAGPWLILYRGPIFSGEQRAVYLFLVFFNYLVRSRSNWQTVDVAGWVDMTIVPCLGAQTQGEKLDANT